MAAVLRACEIRAFNELVKLNQGKRDEVVIIGIDCPGALSNSEFRTFADRHGTTDAATNAYCAAVFSDSPGDEAPALTAACGPAFIRSPTARTLLSSFSARIQPRADGPGTYGSGRSRAHLPGPPVGRNGGTAA